MSASIHNEAVKALTHQAAGWPSDTLGPSVCVRRPSFFGVSHTVGCSLPMPELKLSGVVVCKWSADAALFHVRIITTACISAVLSLPFLNDEYRLPRPAGDAENVRGSWP